MSVLTHDLARLRNEIRALRSARQGLIHDLQREAGDRRADISQMLANFSKGFGAAEDEVVEEKEEKALSSYGGTVSCAFCHGSGRDPFGIMSWLSTCCVCKGRGIVQVQAPHARCAHCGGTGAVKRLTCTVCGGKGLVPLPAGPTVVCPQCQGTGDDASAPAMPCLKCRGRAWLPVE